VVDTKQDAAKKRFNIGLDCCQEERKGLAMSIFYCVVANSHCPLAEYSNGGDKSMNEFAQKLLKKLNLAQDAVEAMDCDGKTFSYRVDNEVHAAGTLAMTADLNSLLGRRQLGGAVPQAH
jgi:hypothetical protein